MRASVLSAGGSGALFDSMLRDGARLAPGSEGNHARPVQHLSRHATRRATRHRNPVLAVLSVALVLAATSSLAGCGLFGDPEVPEPVLPPPPETDIAYGPVTGCGPVDDKCGGSQELDIYRSEKEGPNPVLMFVHGGGFVAGDKVASIPEPLQAVLDDGWDIVSINYRLSTSSGENQFPVAIGDAKRALRWIRANAGQQDWDADNVAAMGSSAGGNLVGMLATTADEPDLDSPDLPPELASVDPSVIAAIPVSAVSDLAMFGANDFFAPALADYLGCSRGCDVLLAEGSVQNHVDASSAPMLAVHGSKDTVAAPVQGELVAEAYRANGIGDRFEMITVEDGPEGFQGHIIQYGRFVDRFVEFLDAHRSN